MALSLEPELYQVAVDENGTYINNIPSLNTIKNGIRCPCGSRKNQIFKTSSGLTKHFDCEKHKSWLKSLNLERVNHYNELIKSKEIVKQQQKQIKELKLELQEKDKIIINEAKEINIKYNVQSPTLLEL